VVSGDLIYGVSPSHPDPEAELERQYGQAVGFLISSADTFFNGNRDRVVLIPGNHEAVRSFSDNQLSKMRSLTHPQPRAHLRGQALKC
jgi:hypothetical protein